MKVRRGKDRNWVRVEELLPCATFRCIHESMSCAISVWCPDGCYDSNVYTGFCIPKCIDCVRYPNRCIGWEKWKDKEQHSATSEDQLP